VTAIAVNGAGLIHDLEIAFFGETSEEVPHALEEGTFGFTAETAELCFDAVAAGANYAIINRLILLEQVAAAFRRVFHAPLQIVYELSHNLVQAEPHPEFGDVWIHRKGATRALPAGHPALQGTAFLAEGHPVLVPGSNRDESYILRPLGGAERSLFSVNHGAGRRMSRKQATRLLDQRHVNDAYRHAGILVNDDGRVPLDEAGACYKPASEVIQAIVDAGLARVETRLWPLASLKGSDRASRQQHAERRAQDKQRSQSRRGARRRKARG
jgi:tRNA-splicing ligase RtcB